MKAMRIVIHGRVQGVGFRWYVMRRAQELGLTGWVRNHPHGVVEAEAVGDEAMLERFVEAVRKGPGTPARVDHTAVQWLDDAGAGASFEIVD